MEEKVVDHVREDVLHRADQIGSTYCSTRPSTHLDSSERGRAYWRHQKHMRLSKSFPGFTLRHSSSFARHDHPRRRGVLR